MATRIKLRRDTTANWADVNPILANGEMGIEADTRRVKLGDGATAWNDLKYAITDQLKIDGKTVSTEMGVSIASQDPETWISSVKAKANWAGVDGVAYDSKGNLYMSGWEEFGYTNLGPSGSGNAFLIKYDSKGTVLWSKYTSLESYTSGGGVIVDSDDNVITVPVSWDDEFFAVTKYTENGTVVWQKTFTDDYEFATGWAVEVDSNNDIVIVGRRSDPDSNDNTGVFVLKINGENGAVRWTRTMGHSNTGVWAPSLTIDGDNNIIFGGMNDNNNSGEANIAKLQSNGDLVWGKSIQNPESEFSGYELCLGNLDSDEDGNIYFVGSYSVPEFVTDLNGDTWSGRAGLILKMNGAGIVQWSRIVGPGDCNSLGAHLTHEAGKIYATFQTERPYYKNDGDRNDNDGYTTQEIILACYDAVSGQVLWQRKFGPEMLWGYVSPTGDPSNTQDRDTQSGRLIAVHGDYIAVAGQAGEYSRADDDETRSYAFVAQLPADGTEMDLEGWAYKVSKQKGLYGKVRTNDYSNVNINGTTDIFVNGNSEYLPTNTADNVRIDLLAAGANQWDFKPNGDLALPVGGNIEISRAAQGSINVVGYFDSDNNNYIFNQFNSVTTDADGNQYYVGQWNSHDNDTQNGNTSMPLVVKVNAQGQVEWKSRLSNTQLYGYDGVDGSANTVAYDPASGNIVVVCADFGEGNSSQMLVVDINPVNGDVVEHHRYRAADDVIANGITINTDGERFITGSMQGDNYIGFTVTNTMLASTATVDTLMIPVATFDGHQAPSWTLGTNGWALDIGNDVNAIDRYIGATGTVREGSGANFDITADGAGGYTVALGTSGGTNYLSGHKIKVLGTSLGGATPDNDAVIIVDTVDAGAITGATINGTSTGSSTYTAQTGTNYNVGSGFTIDVQVVNTTATNNLIVYHANGGTNYVAGDLITFPGTQFGGTSTATDIVITALQVGGGAGDVYSGEDSGYAVTQRGVSPLTYVRLQFASADFTTGGPDYTLRHYTESNAFLAKFVSTVSNTSTSTSMVWANWIEKSYYDKGIAVDYDSTGNVYWATKVRDEETVGAGDNFRERPTITKMSSTGTVLWTKSYSLDGFEGSPLGMQVDSEGSIVLAYSKSTNNNNNEAVVVQRMNSDGLQLWTKKFWPDGAEGAITDSNGGGGLALDNDDNIYFNVERYDGENDVLWSVKLDIQEGDELWQQDISHEGRNTHHGWNDKSNAIATDGKKYYVAGITYDMDGYEGNAIAVALPADGSANDTQHGPFSINETYFYNAEGGNGTNGWNDPVVRNYTLTAAPLTEVTNREPIQAWIETGPTSNYTVYTKSDAGITFGDGTVQTTSGQGIQQIKHNRYGKDIKLKLSDAGKHLYITQSDQYVHVPTYSEVEFPVGTVITVVNISGGNVYITMPHDWHKTTFYCPALDGHESSVDWDMGYRFYDEGGGNLITLMKVEQSWNNGSRWVIAGNNGYSFN